jgi:hypothetical protein
LNDKEPVVFKSEDSLWQMLAKGIKTWDARLNNITDERILRLTKGHWEKNPHPGRMPYYTPDETFVCFENKLTGQVLQFRFRGLTYARFAPGWCFIELSGLVATYDKDGGEMRK